MAESVPRGSLDWTEHIQLQDEVEVTVKSLRVRCGIVLLRGDWDVRERTVVRSAPVRLAMELW